MPRISKPTTLYYHPLQDDGTQGETNLHALLKNMRPQLNYGEYVFCTVDSHFTINPGSIVCLFKEAEGTTLVLNKQTADALHLPYSYVAASITLTVHSSLQATGLTAAFSTALAKASISCNVVAAFYHDHIFVDTKDGEKAIEVLKALAQGVR